MSALGFDISSRCYIVISSGDDQEAGEIVATVSDAVCVTVEVVCMLVKHV